MEIYESEKKKNLENLPKVNRSSTFVLSTPPKIDYNEKVRRLTSLKQSSPSKIIDSKIRPLRQPSAIGIVTSSNSVDFTPISSKNQSSIQNVAMVPSSPSLKVKENIYCLILDIFIFII